MTRTTVLSGELRHATPTEKGNGSQPLYGLHALGHAAASLFIQYLKWSPKCLQIVMAGLSVRMTFDLYEHLFDDIDRADRAMTESAIRVQIASMQQERDKAVDRGFKSLTRRRNLGSR